MLALLLGYLALIREARRSPTTAGERTSSQGVKQEGRRNRRTEVMVFFRNTAVSTA